MAPNALNPEMPEWLLLEDELLLVEMIECGRLFPCCFKWSIEHTAIEFLVLAVKRIIGPRVIKLFSCSTQLSTKFQLLIKTKIPTNKERFLL